MQEKLQYWPDMLVSLAALEDDLTANGAPVEAIQHVQDACRICREFYRRVASENPAR